MFSAGPFSLRKKTPVCDCARPFHAALILHATLFRRWCRRPSSSPRPLPRLSANLRRLLVLSESTVQIEHIIAALPMLYVEFIPVRV
jgi:hypothetical protein